MIQPTNLISHTYYHYIYFHMQIILDNVILHHVYRYNHLPIFVNPGDSVTILKLVSFKKRFFIYIIGYYKVSF